jgi:hypothetical protein
MYDCMLSVQIHPIAPLLEQELTAIHLFVEIPVLPNRLCILLLAHKLFAGDRKPDRLVRFRRELSQKHQHQSCRTVILSSSSLHYHYYHHHHHYHHHHDSGGCDSSRGRDCTHDEILERPIWDLFLLLKGRHDAPTWCFARLDFWEGNGEEESEALADGFADLDDFVSCEVSVRFGVQVDDVWARKG